VEDTSGGGGGGGGGGGLKRLSSRPLAVFDVTGDIDRQMLDRMTCVPKADVARHVNILETTEGIIAVAVPRSEVVACNNSVALS
jgi:hypothetical protein